MQTGKIVFKGKSEKNKDIVIRYPLLDDAGIMHDYINTISQERTFLRFQGEKVSLEEEKKHSTNILSRIKNKKSVELLAFYEDKLIGISGISLYDKIQGHVGVFGISVAKNYRGEGIGKILMESVINESIKNIPQLQILTLNVLSNNTLAHQMYEKFGFKIYGNLPKGATHRGEYVDYIMMYKNIRED